MLLGEVKYCFFIMYIFVIENFLNRCFYRLYLVVWSLSIELWNHLFVNPISCNCKSGIQHIQADWDIILYFECYMWFKCILNAISYAPHILLMTTEVNESQFPKFSFQFIWHWSHNNTFKRKLFCRIPVFYNSVGPE